MKILSTNKATGEIVELPVNTPKEIVDAWRIAQEYIKTAESIKDQLKEIVPALVGSKGRSEPVGDYQFVIYPVQRKTYDKSIMRKVLDEDLFDTLLKPDKAAVDKYLKENLDQLEPGISHELRATMLPEGSPYEIIKLEKIKE